MGFDMYVPTRVLFGAGALNNLHTQKMCGKKTMIDLEDCVAIYEAAYK